MVQVEFDKLMNDIRREQEETNKMMREQLAEIETRRVIARKEYDDAHDKYKAICSEIAQKQRELKDINANYYERKKALIKAFPKAYGTQKEDNCRLRNMCYGLRAKLIEDLKNLFKDNPNIDAENIQVNFTIETTEGKDVGFSVVIPHKNGTNE